MDSKKTISILSSVTDNENSIIIEKYIREYSEDKTWYLYQVIGKILKGYNIDTIIEELKTGKVGWNSSEYNDYKNKIEEHDNYIVSPFDVVEGVVQCPKCKNKKTYSTQKQIRSADEPMTTISRCVNCGHSWNYSG